ncbi:MAG: NUDIX domain-containing protein [Ktedonobacteraceae bacterium]|nr:NUDIX domain-containing protein [Ktedonobacteraceae bacterium]
MEPTLEKVSAFITREGAAGKELLVFEHEGIPEAGVQVPAGTVEPGEAFEQAVLRETHEEAGLARTRIVADFGTLVIDLPEGKYALTAAVTLRQAPFAAAPPCLPTDTLGPPLKRGMYMQLEEEQGEWVRMTYYENGQSLAGWLPRRHLATRLIRRLYHLVSLDSTPDSWTTSAEDRYHFHLYWLPLVPRPHLELSQDLWLDHVYEQLLK